MTVTTGTDEDAGVGIEPAGGNTNSINEYDSWNQLTKTMQNGKTASYTYNGDGLRMSKTVDGTTTRHIWDGTNIAGDVTNETVTKYIRGIQLISSKTDSNESFYTYNAHGDVVQLTNGSGDITKQYSYDAFGVEQNKDVNDTNPFRYCGEYFDGETESVYLRARYYSPVSGRFITEDPIRDGLNWYTYCRANPINYSDPTGEAFGVTIRDARDITAKFGLGITNRVRKASNRARDNAVNKAKLWGLKNESGELVTWDNRADAMRHFQWNAIMMREIYHDVAKYVGDRHEINGAKNAGLFQEENSNTVRMRVGQASLMDLWNNSVGRTLGKDENLDHLNYDDLFYYAEASGLLITDATKAFEFYGITDYVDWDTWTVGIVYDMGAETIKVMKEGLPDIVIQVGIESWW